MEIQDLFKMLANEPDETLEAYRKQFGNAYTELLEKRINKLTSVLLRVLLYKLPDAPTNTDSSLDLIEIFKKNEEFSKKQICSACKNTTKLVVAGDLDSDDLFCMDCLAEKKKQEYMKEDS
jgi:hypothetical protein